MLFLVPAVFELHQLTVLHGRQGSMSEEQMEADPSSVWGLCLCVAGVHHPGGLAVARETQHEQQQNHRHHLQQQRQQQPKAEATRRQQQRATSTPVNATNGQSLKDGHARIHATTTTATTAVAIPAPTPTDTRGWRVECSVFGHRFCAERLTDVPHRKSAAAQTASAAGSDLALGGREAHAYLQCGVSRLRQLLSGDGSARGGGGILSVQLFHDGDVVGDGEGEGVLGGDDGDVVRCHCEVRGCTRVARARIFDRL